MILQLRSLGYRIRTTEPSTPQPNARAVIFDPVDEDPYTQDGQMGRPSILRCGKDARSVHCASDRSKSEFRLILQTFGVSVGIATNTLTRGVTYGFDT